MERLTRWDSAEFLEDEEDIVGYLRLAVERGDEAHFVFCLSNAIRARAINQLAKETGVAREKIYELFSPDAKPSKATIAKVTKVVSAPLGAAVGG